MDPRRVALLFVVVGLVCLPAPLYLGWAAGAVSPPPRTSQIYAAEPLDPTNASDREDIASNYASDVVLSTHQVSEQYSAGEYRAPETSRRTLETAMATGEATTADPDARADLRRLGNRYGFVHDAYGDREQYYRLRVRDGGAEVRAAPVSADRVANVTVARTAFAYGNLTAGERRTVDRILGNSTGGDDPTEHEGYRPRVDDPFVDELPALVVKDGTLYGLFVYGWVDDFGPGFYGTLVGAGVALLGAAAVLTGGVFSVYAWWRDGTEA